MLTPRIQQYGNFSCHPSFITFIHQISQCVLLLTWPNLVAEVDKEVKSLTQDPDWRRSMTKYLISRTILKKCYHRRFVLESSIIQQKGLFDLGMPCRGLSFLSCLGVELLKPITSKASRCLTNVMLKSTPEKLGTYIGNAAKCRPSWWPLLEPSNTCKISFPCF